MVVKRHLLNVLGMWSEAISVKLKTMAVLESCASQVIIIACCYVIDNVRLKFNT